MKKGSKRQKTNESHISAVSQISCGGGISSMKWNDPTQILVGCYDHAIKIVNVDRAQVVEVLFTNHKVATCMDAVQSDILITGHEDAVVRLWDIRSGQQEKKFKSAYDSHTKYVSQVKFNYNVENVFLSSSYDGLIKMWDLRNEDRPVATLKRKDDKSHLEDYKVFALEWNGASQILSGGSDSHISVHEIQE